MTGETHIWAILLAAGLTSAALAQVRALAPFAAIAYAPLGIVIPLYSMWYWRRHPS